MSSKSISPLFLQKIDDLTRRNHPFLHPKDEIYFLGEYTTKGSFNFSKTNQIILNYKKDISHKNCPDWHHKEKAIIQVAENFNDSISKTLGLSERFNSATLVPIPPSKNKTDPTYDNRNYLMLQRLSLKRDIRELILQNTSRKAQRELQSHRIPANLSIHYVLNEVVAHPKPREIWLFDDVLVKGTTFRATHDFLKKVFPDIPICGFFIARAVNIDRPS